MWRLTSQLMLLFSIAWMLSACHSHHTFYQHDIDQKVAQSTSKKNESKSKTKFHISQNDSVYIALPPNAINHEGQPIENSGLRVAKKLYHSLVNQIDRTKLGTRYRKHKNAMALAKANGYDYLIEPHILSWERHPTLWTGVPDQLKVELIVYSTQLDKRVQNYLIKGRGNHMVSLYHKPVAYLQTPIKKFVDKIVVHNT